jgi:alkylated DNA repair dioxygenase AlkB
MEEGKLINAESLFPQGPNPPEKVLSQQGEVLLWPRALAPEEAEYWFQTIRGKAELKNYKVFVYGKWHSQPRLTGWMAVEGVSYRYSHLSFEGHGIEGWMIPLWDRIERLCQTRFNSVLINFYRDGNDRMGAHRDLEPELGSHPTLASLSLGGPRKMIFRHDKRPWKKELMLQGGSCILMKPPLQTHWTHEIPRTRRPCTERINLTFRQILTLPKGCK